MTKTIDFKPPKTEPEFMPILRWEDDGGSTFEGDQPIDPPSGVAETNNPQSMDMIEDDLSNNGEGTSA